MNLLLLKPEDLIDAERAIIRDQRLEHLHKVLAVKRGDSIKVGLLNGDIGQALITDCQLDEIQLQFSVKQAPPPALALTVVMALPRPKMLRRILRNLAEFGIKECHFINAYKVEKSFWQTPVLASQTIEHYLLQGLSQAKDTVLPNIHVHKRFKPFVEDILPSLIADKEAFVAHPYNSGAMPAASHKERLIVIGPEGGFTDYEVDLICQQGIQPISMGPRIYRVENALTLLSTQLSIQHPC